MRPHVLRVTAFGAFAAPAEVRFDELADSGLFLLHGETGAGKTTLLDAIGFALYGRVPGERGKTRRLRSDHAAASARTEVSFEASIGGRRLRITRSPQQVRPKRHGTGVTTEPAKVLVEEQVAGTWRAVSTRANEADREIADAMGMSAEQFFQVVLLPQGQFARFLQADADERRALLQRLFRTDRFRAVEDWLAERRKKTRDRVVEAERGIGQLAARIAQVAGVPVPGDVDDGGAEAAGPDAAGAQAAPAGPDAGPAIAGGPGLTASWADGLAAAAAAARDAAAGATEARRGELDEALQVQAAARELADRQRRRADALRRQDELQAAEPDIAGLRQEFDAAVRAAEIARAFTDADRAAEALTAAQQAEDDARAVVAAAGVPAAAPAGELRAAAQERQQHVGRLAGLRDLAERAEAEDSAAAAARQRAAGRDAELRDSEQVIADQRAERERLIAARDAAFRAAERLPAVHAQAQRQRTAAGDAANLAEARAGQRDLHEQRESARERANDLREHALRIREERFDGMIAELAANLTDDTPCPVCGSSDHPFPSDIRGRRVTHHEEEQAVAEADAARDAVAKLDTELAGLGVLAADLAARLAAAGVTDTALPDGGAPGTAGGPEAIARLAALAATLAAEAEALEAEAAGLDAAAGGL
ncbi:MAG TPA: AAA family ATPase, partial [Streptosporangiaceae bacterium]